MASVESGLTLTSQGVLVAPLWTPNHTTANGNYYKVDTLVNYEIDGVLLVYRCIADNDSIVPTNDAYWVSLGAGYIIPQEKPDWDAVSGDSQILNKPDLSVYIEEAPIDDLIYSRQNATWIASSLPTDEIIEVDNYSELPFPGVVGVLYLTLDTSKLFVWNGSYSEVNQSSISPFSNITEGGNIGIVRTARNPLNYGDIGSGAIDFSTSTESSSTYGATGPSSFASGRSNKSPGSFSHSQNIQNKANGYASSASGIYNVASGRGEMATGMYGTEYTATDTVTDKVFNVGAGTSTSNKKDAFSLFRNFAAKFTPAALSSITNQVAGFFIFDSSDSNRPAVHNGTAWKKLAYQDDVPTITIDSIPTDGSNNSVSSNGTFDALANKVDKVVGKELSTNDYTTLEQTKLAGIAAGAEVNVNADWNATSGDAQILNKPTIPSAVIVDSIPTNGSSNAVSSDGVFDALALKADLVAGKVPSSQLPSYVDDVIEGYYSVGVFYSNVGLTTPITGETGKIYVDLLANKSYRWSGSVYIQISNTISSIDELTDVTVSSPLNGQLLQYNTTTSQWENQSIVVGTGDMQKSTYDIDNDGIVDFAETIPVTVRNPSISNILRKGTIVYLNGSTGWRPNAYKAQANAEATSSGTFGVVLSDIATNSDGTIATLGTIHTLNTSNTAPYPFTADVLVDGDVLWLDPNNAGYVTKTKPQAPNHAVFIGVVARTHPSLGRIVYRITNGYELDELHNVFINGTLANKHTLYYDSATSLWKTNTIAGILGFDPTQLLTAVTVDAYLGSRLKPVDTASNGFHFRKSINGSIGYVAYNSNTGNGAVATNGVGIDPTDDYNNNTYIAHFGTGYYIPQLAGQGALISTKKLFVGAVGTGDIDFVTGADYSTITSKLKILANGQLQIGVTPATGSTSDFVLVRDSSGNVKQVAYPTGGVPFTRQEFTFTGSQSFTLSGIPSFIYGVFVQGQELDSSQYSSTGTTLTILNTLGTSDSVNILYTPTTAGVLEYYTKTQVDAFLTDKVLTSRTISTTAPLTGGGDLSANRTISIPMADADYDGYLSSSAFNTFTLKQDPITLTTNNFSGQATLIGSTINIPNYGAFIPKLEGNEPFRGVNYSNNSTTEVTSGGVTMATTATLTARAVASTNFAAKQVRKGFTATVVSGGRYTGTRGSALLFFMGGGFKYVCDFYVSDTTFASGCRQFYGMAGVTTDLTYTDAILVSSLTNIIGVGSDALDTNLQVFHNDATGTATKIDLGVNFPANRTAGVALTTVYGVVLYNKSNGDIKYSVENKETGFVATGTINTNLPLGTQGLNFFASRCMGGSGGTTNSGQFDLLTLGVYSI